MARLAGVLASVLVIGIGLPVASVRATQPLVINGVGAAHGFGLAMDGVEGQARAGWTHDRILDLFYPGSAPGRAAGPIRVGLAEVGHARFTVPNGGIVSDAPRGSTAGFSVPLAAGSTVSLTRAAGGVAVSINGKPLTAPVPARPTAAATADQDPAPPPLLPTPPPLIEPEPTPSPKPKKGEPASGTTGPAGARVAKTVWLFGTGTPAIVGVDATGRRYRGAISATLRASLLSVINHVDLETYVAGIAEEKGAGWPLEGLKTLAVAARTLAAATLSWYSKNHENGYDICPTDSCQVYLGYDGEEPLMQRATSETAGAIRTFKGRPILAMYHGNGGGQTESYERVIDNGTDPHPYLSSVTYPFADPSSWQRKTSLPEIEAALRNSDVAVPGTLARVEIIERGESPRVMNLRLVTTKGDQEVGGVRFADALDLRSTWFEIDADARTTGAVVTGPSVTTEAATAGLIAPARPGTSWWAAPLTALLAIAALIAALLGTPEASSLRARIPRGLVRRARLRLRHSTT